MAPLRLVVGSGFAETLLYQLGDSLWSRGNTVSKSIRLRELIKRCRVRLLTLDEFQHFVDVRRASIVNDVADWLKEQVEEPDSQSWSQDRSVVWKCSGKMNNCGAASVRRYE
jgi:hypothetical protein